MSIAPPTGEPHLIEKLKMLSNFTLSKPIDIFDLFIHSIALIILILKIIRTFMAKNKPE